MHKKVLFWYFLGRTQSHCRTDWQQLYFTALEATTQCKF